MHAIRSKARQSAWTNSDPENRTFNPWARIGPNYNRAKDVERDGAEPLHHISTESSVRSPTEARRQDESYAHSPKKHGTFPRDPSDSPREPEHSNGIAKTDHAPNSTATGTSAQPVDTTENSTVRTKKGRKFAALKFCGKADEDEEHPKKEKKRKHKKIPVMQQARAVFMSWINILLVFVPVGLAIEYSGVNGILSFVMNFIAIIPLASMLSFATEELAYYVGDTFGGLLNATFGNATELIVSIIALLQKKVIIVKTSLIGSILSNLLLVLGMCFVFGGINRREQFFNITVAQTAASLLALAIGALITPTAFRYFSDEDAGVQPLSHAGSILLLLTYIAYLVFQLRTHIDMYNEPSQKVEKENLLKKNKSDKSSIEMERGLDNMNKGPAQAGGAVGRSMGEDPEKTSAGSDDKQSGSDENDKPEEEEHHPQLSAKGALITLAISTALIAVTSDGMVSGIDSVQGAISEEFIGLILVPIVGNAAEHATAVTVAIKDKMDLAIGVAVGSSLQIALLVIPVMVLLFWFGVGQPNEYPMDLNFDSFQVTVLFIAIILVNYVIQDGRSNWLEGVMLFITYVIFAVAAWYYPALNVPA